jgi:hypothetical protein
MTESARGGAGDTSRIINIRRFRSAVLSGYGTDEPICAVMRNEPDELTVDQLLDRFSIYVPLLRQAESRAGRRPVSGMNPQKKHGRRPLPRRPTTSPIETAPHHGRQL